MGINPRTAIQQLIGEQGLQRCKNSYPLVALCCYRISTKGALPVQQEGLFTYDGVNPASSFWKRTLKTLLRLPLYVLARVASGKRASKQVTTLLSDTFLQNSRYHSTLREMSELHHCSNFVAYQNIRLCRNIWQALHKALGRDFPNIHFHFPHAFTFVGRKLRRAILELHSFLYILDSDNRVVADEPEKGWALLDTLEREFTLRMQFWEEKLKKHSIKKYITINQFNAKDVLMIVVCKHLGIKTTQFEHHAFQFGRVIIDDTRLNYTWMFADEYICWNKAELELHRKHFVYVNMVDDKLPVIVMGGNPELTYDRAIMLGKQIPVRRRATFMVPHFPVGYWGNDITKDAHTWKKRVFTQLAKLSEREHIEIRLRHNPSEYPEIRGEDSELAAKLGFTVSAGTQETLMEDVFSSIVVFGLFTSVLGLAEILGRTVYRIEDLDPVYQHYAFDSDVIDVTVEQIGGLMMPEKTYTRPIKKEDFLDYDKLTN